MYDHMTTWHPAVWRTRNTQTSDKRNTRVAAQIGSSLQSSNLEWQPRAAAPIDSPEWQSRAVAQSGSQEQVAAQSDSQERKPKVAAQSKWQPRAAAQSGSQLLLKCAAWEGHGWLRATLALSFAVWSQVNAQWRFSLPHQLLTLVVARAKKRALVRAKVSASRRTHSGRARA